MKEFFQFDRYDLYDLSTACLGCFVYFTGTNVLVKAEMDSLVNEGILFLTVVMAAAYVNVVFGSLLSRCLWRIRERLASPVAVVGPAEAEASAALAASPKAL